MAIETIRTQPRGDADKTTGVIDISELPTDRVQAVATDEDVYLERRGNRTFLVPA